MLNRYVAQNSGVDLGQDMRLLNSALLTVRDYFVEFTNDAGIADRGDTLDVYEFSEMESALAWGKLHGQSERALFSLEATIRELYI